MVGSVSQFQGTMNQRLIEVLDTWVASRHIDHTVWGGSLARVDGAGNDQTHVDDDVEGLECSLSVRQGNPTALSTRG